MKYSFCFFCFWILLGVKSFSQKDLKNDSINSFFGDWKVKKVDFLNISSMEDSVVKRLSAKGICLDENQAIIFGEKYNNPYYTIKSVDADSLLTLEFGMDSKAIGVHSKSILIIKVIPCYNRNIKTEECELLASEHALFYIQDGVVFILNRLHSP